MLIHWTIAKGMSRYNFGYRGFFLTLLLILVAYYLFPYATQKPREKNQLERIIERGYVVVATRNSPTTYYLDTHGPAGFEYNMAYHFAESLGIGVKFILLDNTDDMVQYLQSGEVDIIASGLPISKTTSELLRYSSAYLKAEMQIIDLQKTEPRPRAINDLIAPLSVQPIASHLEIVGELKQKFPDLDVVIEHDLDVDELVQKLIKKQTRYILANSNEIQVIRHFYPELRVAFTLPQIKDLAWSMKKSDDFSLINTVDDYFLNIKMTGYLTELYERHYGHIENFDYSGTQLFMGRIKRRLPRYEALFKEAGEKYNIDWRLLAAMGHQESHWDRNATSPTGVRGLMMLTLSTAAQLGVDNRLDPRQSIMGGAEYFSYLLKRLPESIQGQDRTWMALASYNIGYGHVMGARKIATELYEDPDKWISIKRRLPLLTQKKWYKKLKYGYARGYEPVLYVQNIRRYYDILRRLFPEYIETQGHPIL